ncbi:MAG: S8 family serine peptidase [Sphingobacteriales bacterium]|nr:S8 family serine peptidase [Sphingobacteriales bacterium]
MTKIKHSGAAIVICLIGFNALAQNNEKPAFKDNEETLKTWYLKDRATEGYFGISLDKAYNFLKAKNKKSKTILVAVIDSGIDTTQPDLKNILWTNPNEIPGNGKDDDGNGYADDIHGWNFLGGSDGKNVDEDSYEGARIYHGLMGKYDGKPIDESKLSKEELYEYKTWKKAKEKVEAQAAEAQNNIIMVGWLKRDLPKSDSIIKLSMNKEVYTGDELEAYEATTKVAARAKLIMMAAFEGFSMKSSTNKEIIEELNDYYSGEEKKANAIMEAPEDYRGEIVKDKYNDFSDRYYGNNDVMAAHFMHGTHVSGIIGAQRNNNIGMDGIADNVKIMMIRAVPNGDEHDKDVALAIRYAVDNGAKIVNMSFGKSFSPEKKWVDEAVKYAESKNVLLVQGAGNDNENNDVEENFPNRNFINGGSATNYMDIGASSDTSIKQINNQGKEQKDLVAYFSNYGKKEVDVFAPGYKIYSAKPDGKFGFLNGTSMASPVVAGIAALTLSYYPQLTAQQLKSILMKSVQAPGFKVMKPGTDEKVNMSDISQSGGIINAYEAIKLADALTSQKTKKPVKPKIVKTKKG